MAKLTDETLAEFYPMVAYWARHYAHRRHQVLDVDDLMVVGMIGLLDAHKRYRPEKGSLFKSYAEFRVRGEIVDELRRQDWMTRSERRKQKSYQKAEGQLSHNLGRHPTRQEMAKVLDFPAPVMDRLAQYEQAETLRPYHEGDASADLLSSEIERHDEVLDLLNHLQDPMRTIIEMRYYQEASVEEIARVIGLSSGRVSQLHNEAILLMRDLTMAGMKRAA